jgi:glycosyltransferase involved in cell wall biosynthesis
MPKLSIIISAYGSGRWVKNRLDNIYACYDIDNYEVIFVNANSPDELDESIPNTYPLKYIKTQERIGLYAAWNLAIEQSSGEYITNANTDDIVAPQLYRNLCNILDSGSDFAYPSWYTTGVENQQWDKLHSVDNGGRPGYYAGDIDKAGVGHFPMWRKSLHEKVGLFDDRYLALGDADFWARCYYQARAKFTWHDKFEACYLYRNGENLWNRVINGGEWDMYRQKLATIKT